MVGGFVSPKSLGQSDMVLQDVIIAMSGLLEVLITSDLLEFLI